MAFYKMVKPRRMSDQFNAIIARVDNTEEEARRDVVETPDKPQWRRKVINDMRPIMIHSLAL